MFMSRWRKTEKKTDIEIENKRREKERKEGFFRRVRQVEQTRTGK